MGPWEKRRLLYKHIGEFLREMAVLVIVFGQPGWVLAFVLMSMLAFALGHWCGIEAEEHEHEQR